jgi:hypothetical protein
MDKKRTTVLRLVVAAITCAVPGTCIFAYAQEPTPPPENRQADRDKKHASQDEEKARRSAETKPGSHAAQPQPQERRDRPAGSAERQAQERQNHPAAERPRTEGAPAPNRGAQPAHAARPAPNAHYQFRQQDKPRLRQHFQSQLAHVDRHNRPHVVVGAYLPSGWQTYIVPVPVEVVTYLPPPPEGYELAFYNGYIIVYDPLSGLILSVTDLLD